MALAAAPADRSPTPPDWSVEPDPPPAGEPTPAPSDAADPVAGGAPCPLSLREREVAVLVARGHTNREIGTALGISERTVESHVEKIRRKLGARSRAGVAAWVGERGLLASPD